MPEDLGIPIGAGLYIQAAGEEPIAAELVEACREVVCLWEGGQVREAMDACRVLANEHREVLVANQLLTVIRGVA